MSRLSLKPGGEPGKWAVYLDTHSGTFYQYDVPDDDLRAIRATIDEYLDAKEPVVEKRKERTLYTFKLPMWGVLAACAVLITVLGLGIGFLYPLQKTIAPSTGGVIDELCMRPGVECSTNIHYVHPQEPR